MAQPDFTKIANYAEASNGERVLRILSNRGTEGVIDGGHVGIARFAWLNLAAVREIALAPRPIYSPAAKQIS